jgi:hypothetical protein
MKPVRYKRNGALFDVDADEDAESGPVRGPRSGSRAGHPPRRRRDPPSGRDCADTAAASNRSTWATPMCICLRERAALERLPLLRLPETLPG